MSIYSTKSCILMLLPKYTNKAFLATGGCASCFSALTKTVSVRLSTTYPELRRLFSPVVLALLAVLELVGVRTPRSLSVGVSFPRCPIPLMAVSGQCRSRDGSMLRGRESAHPSVMTGWGADVRYRGDLYFRDLHAEMAGGIGGAAVCVKS